MKVAQSLFVLSLLAISATAPQAQASECRSTGWFGGGKAYLICQNGRKFGPYENGTACQVAEAFQNKCGEAGKSQALLQDASFRNKTVVLEKPMSQAACLAAIHSYASAQGYDLQEWEANDFYLLQDGEKAGNAYFSSGSCYIYLDN